MNSINLIGSIVKNEMKYLPSGLAITETTLAGDAERGTWYTRVSSYAAIAEDVINQPVGTIMLVNGELQYRSWETKDGEKRSMINVKANEIYPVRGDFQTVDDARGQPILQNSLHVVTLSGNLTRDIEPRDFSEARVINATLARTQRMRSGPDESHYFDISAWSDKPAFDALLEARKGDTVFVWGSLMTRSYEKDGQKKWRTEIVTKDAHVAKRLDDDPIPAPASAGIDEFPPSENLPF